MKRNNTNPSQLEINFQATDPETMHCIDFRFIHSRHSFLRASQRGIKKESIQVALQYGKDVYKQGFIFYILGENNIPPALYKDRAKLKNIVVVVSGDSNQVITCYRSPDPFRNIRLKSKTLVRHKIAA